MPSQNAWLCRTLLLAASIVLLPLDPSMAEVQPTPARCSAMKLRAAGRDLTATLRCHARAKRRGIRADPACLARASAALDRTFARAGTLCNGSVRGATVRLVQWQNTLLNDVAGGGRCPASEILATRRAVQSFGILATHPTARQTAKSVLSIQHTLCRTFRRAGDCGVDCEIVFGHVSACWKQLASEVGVPTASTTTAGSPSFGVLR